MNYFQIKIYKSTLDLERQFCLSTQKTKRILKYGKIDLMHQDILDLLVDIAFANISDTPADRLFYLQKCGKIVDTLKIQFRVLLDIHAITSKGYAVISNSLEDVSRQLVGWTTSTEKLITPKP